MPRSSACRTSAASRFGGCSTARSSTASAPAARSTGELPLVDDELLGQHRHADGRADALAGRRSSRRTSAARTAPRSRPHHRPRRRCARATRSSPVAAIRPADGDDRLSSAITCRPGAASRSAIGRGVGAADRGPVGEPRQLAVEIEAPLLGDLARRRSDAPRRPRSRGDLGGHVRRRSARSRSSRSVTRPASIVSAARSIPASRCSTSPATRNAAPALSSTTSRFAPARRGRCASIVRAFSSGVPPASRSRSVVTRRPSLDAGISWRSMPVRTDVVQDPAVVERQLVDARAVDDERPLCPEPLGDLGDPSAAAGVAHAQQLAARAGRVRQADRAG